MAKELAVSLGKNIETQDTQGTLEGGRVFLGMGPHCMRKCGELQAEPIFRLSDAAHTLERRP